MPSAKDIVLGAKPTIDAPLPLKSTLPAVEKLSTDMLPPQLSGFVFDVSERTQCPPEYVAVAVIVALSTVVGCKYAIMPKQYDNWEVRINQWGSLIGPPSAMKSPALKESIRPIIELEKESNEFQRSQNQDYQIFTELSKVGASAIKKQASELLNNGMKAEALEKMKAIQLDEPPAKADRKIVNDATVEKLGELMNENPNGLMLLRDELSGFFAKLSQEDSQLDRAFYLECFDGNNRFTYDRIGRGTIVIENCMLSVLGGIQPSKIAKLIRMAMSGDVDDGLIQRLQLAVWPDPVTEWQWKDLAPSKEAYLAYRDLVREFDRMKPATDGPIALRFSQAAQLMFAKWMTELQGDIRNSDYHPVIQSHLAKSPKCIAALALLFELIQGGRSEVSVGALTKALAWAKFLKSHALRLYSITTSSSLNNAKLILKRRSKLKNSFTIRDVRRKGWAGLTENTDIRDALDCLVDHNYLIELNSTPGAAGGRPTNNYYWSPTLEQDP
ncbi:YfjI family protein [Dasania marina]|uniref:YfjI family protein n=1 Tax=Dasania marina TaxID=471499 RepID=UPI0030D7AE78|tara:strand:- start:3097 stop:4593 length:1497 start_codon:yes stop_codon:yes gene_type:complete